MGVSVKIKKGKTKDLEKLIQHLKMIQAKTVQTGFFTEQGKHTSGDYYTTIMQIHEDGLAGNPARKVLTIGSLELQAGDSRPFNKAVNNLVGGMGTIDAGMRLVAEASKEHIQTIFGDGSKLPVTNNTTPLIDTGELSENLMAKVV